jgi:hypothetical protein
VRRRTFSSNTPTWQPTITQKIRTALVEAGHDELVTEILDTGLKELETTIEHLAQRVQALENAERERFTKTGALQLFKAESNKKAVDWGRWALRAVGGAGLVGVGHLILKALGK